MYVFIVADILEVDIAFLCGLTVLLILAIIAARKTLRSLRSIILLNLQIYYAVAVGA